MFSCVVTNVHAHSPLQDMCVIVGVIFIHEGVIESDHFLCGYFTALS